MNRVYIKKAAILVTTAVVLSAAYLVGKSLLKPKVSVDVSELEIKLPTGLNSVKIGSSQKAVIKALGQPKQIAAYSSQANYKEGTVLNYNGAKFIFIHDKLTNFEITSHKYRVGLASTHKYSSIGSLKSDLPHFKIQDKTAFLDVTNEDSTTDQYLEYDLNDNGQVTKISYADY
ncbi:MAG: hypothetical protein ABIN91_06840 [Mucilaginibacter sp.]|uniref:hypothetical protein n=1 Tax=Mucilaginibacter sp. TaxID=1882438 RepID=UPI0032678F7C